MYRRPDKIGHQRASTLSTAGSNWPLMSRQFHRDSIQLKQMEPGTEPSPRDVADFNQTQEFIRDACPSSWLEHAEELRDAAELIWKRHDDGLRVGITLDSAFTPVDDARRFSEVSRTYMLLAGFALENLIKGLLVYQDPSHVNRGVLSDDLKSHNLVTLASKLKGLALSPAERQFCHTATSAIPYWGRYPIPLKRNQVTPEIGVDANLRRTFLALFDRLAHALYWAVRDGWDSGAGPKTLKIRSNRYGDWIDPKEPLI